ncbi:MAG: TetR/AcrR family transcriptional regulator [Alphaproteobacteria bacterium]|nr:TetR/AcrR family transcriptional regulator [Alphaproteobacteria bacterium]
MTAAPAPLISVAAERLEARHRDVASERRAQIVQGAVQAFAEKGYFGTTIEDIAARAGVSKGLIYVYFEDKQDVLFLTLHYVLDTYARELPALLEGVEGPLERLEKALSSYCRLIDRNRAITDLAYQVTTVLPAKQRAQLKATEFKVNRILQSCLEACFYGGLMRPANLDFLVYQYVMFCHSWALKRWAFEDKYSLEDYIAEGVRLLIEPHLTSAGREHWGPVPTITKG